jgi:signal peptidase I
MLLMAALAGLAGLARSLRRQFVVVTVFGASMEPEYQAGQRLLASRAQRARREIKRGQVIVVSAGRPTPPASAADPADPPHWLVIKRVAAIAGDAVPACVAAARPELAGTIVPAGQLIILGDNAERSHDSRHQGLVPADRVRAVALRPRRPLSHAHEAVCANCAGSTRPALP